MPQPMLRGGGAENCPICGSNHLNCVLTLENIVCCAGAVYKTVEDAKRAPKGNLKLIQCQECGFIWNIVFEMGLDTYQKLVTYRHYVFSYKYSPAFQKYLDFLVTYLQNNYQIHNAKIVEIGCGDAHVLYTLAKATDSKAVGYEPSFATRKLNLPHDFSDYVEVISEYYNKSATPKDADVILCRHVLEHISEPLEFLRSIQQTLCKKNPLIVFEVPYLKNSSSQEGFCQFIYEHCNYFSPKSLVKIFEKAGFEVLETFRCFENGAFQLIFARLAQNDSKHYSCTEKSLFERAFDLNMIRDYRQKLESFESIAIWCAGSSAQILYHLLESPQKIRCFIDIDPEKQGNFMAVSGLPILSPQQAIEEGIKAVIVGNPNFKDEIIQMIEEYSFELIM